MFPVLFAIPRTAGWLAQWEEMLRDPEQKIARPRQIYTGPGAARLRQPGEEAMTVRGTPFPSCPLSPFCCASPACTRRSRRRRNSTATAPTRTSVNSSRSAPASRAHRRAGRARVHRKQLQAAGITVEEQPFEATTPIGRVKMVNLRATLPASGAASKARLVIGGHYDTKLFKEFTFRRRQRRRVERRVSHRAGPRR